MWDVLPQNLSYSEELFHIFFNVSVLLKNDNNLYCDKFQKEKKQSMENKLPGFS